MNRLRFLSLAAAGLAFVMLAGCTTYTYPDGSRETVLGTPAEDETLTPQERRTQPIRYRVPGDIPE